MASENSIELGSRIHFVGIGGMGMAPLAMVLAESGFVVSGEDAGLAPEVARWLEARGIVISSGSTLDDEVMTVVYSTAVSVDHPRLLEARQRGLSQYRRGEALAAFAGSRRLIAVAGSHGKTTTCAMLVTALRSSGLDIGYVMGGLFADESLPPASRGSSDWLVAELDESDGTIGLFAPEITLCVNVDLDHCDRYAELVDIEDVFRALASRTKSALFYNRSCPVSHRLFGESSDDRTISFGPGGDFDLLGSIEGGEGRVLSLGGRFGQTTARIRAQGGFNSMNACGALAIAGHLGRAPDSDLLARFPGVRRRQGILVVGPHLTVMEDYAHHPAEIRALIEAVRPSVSNRLVVVFQPHRYSRTARFKAEFTKALADVDKLFLMDVYPASETPVDGGRLEDLLLEFARACPEEPRPCVVADDQVGRLKVAGDCREGDLLLFVGAGTIDRFARRVVAELGARGDRMGRLTRFFQAIADRPNLGEILRVSEPLARKTTIGVGGAAELYAEPTSIEELQVLLAAAHESRLPVRVLGRGSNLIVPDEGVTGLVLRLQHSNWRRISELTDHRIQVGGGVRLKELCGHATREGWEGFEFLEGIPGTLGGALRMNAGAMGGWIFEVVEEVHLMSLTGEIRFLKREDLTIEYRRCADLADAIAIGGILRPASPADHRAIRERVAAYRIRRQESQPREPSAGCIFKNPAGDSAGRLIDELGMKGERVGDAEVSRIHGNFIVNRGAATADDVVALVRKVRDRVKAERKITLEPEVLLYGRDWEDVL
jgi:UDP-N-acetylmuramate--L-alanine ligase/UDP-N-acetylenolpyruvoylglucosamine reductase